VRKSVLVSWQFFGAILVSIIFGCSNRGVLSQSRTSKAITSQKIYESELHSAFTDITFYKGKYYVVFREASKHVLGTDGQIVILMSKDGLVWDKVGMLSKTGVDLRDPKLSITADDRLMVIMGGSTFEGEKVVKMHTHVSFLDGAKGGFSYPEPIELDSSIPYEQFWVWRVTWYKGEGYAICFPPQQEGITDLYLVKTVDGVSYRRVSTIPVSNFPNESTIRFDSKGAMHVLIRTDSGDRMGYFARSEFPYHDWNFEKLDIRLGGPNFLFLPNGRICVGSRAFEWKDSTRTSLARVYTSLFTFDEHLKVDREFPLPSNGDTSYTGMLVVGNELWISYFSQHEGGTAIYLSKVPLSYFD